MKNFCRLVVSLLFMELTLASSISRPFWQPSGSNSRRNPSHISLVDDDDDVIITGEKRGGGWEVVGAPVAKKQKLETESPNRVVDVTFYNDDRADMATISNCPYNTSIAGTPGPTAARGPTPPAPPPQQQEPRQPSNKPSTSSSSATLVLADSPSEEPLELDGNSDVRIFDESTIDNEKQRINGLLKGSKKDRSVRLKRWMSVPHCITVGDVQRLLAGPELNPQERHISDTLILLYCTMMSDDANPRRHRILDPAILATQSPRLPDSISFLPGYTFFWPLHHILSSTNHWTLLIIELDQIGTLKFTHYDPAISVYKRTNVLNKAMNVINNHLNPPEHFGISKVQPVKDFLAQHNDTDCGIFVMEYVKRKITGDPLNASTISSQETKDIQQRARGRMMMELLYRKRLTFKA